MSDLSTNLTPEPTELCGHKNCRQPYDKHLFRSRYCPGEDRFQEQHFTPAAPVPVNLEELVKLIDPKEIWEADKPMDYKNTGVPQGDILAKLKSKKGAVEPVGSERIIPNVTAPDGLTEQSLRIKLVAANARVADLTREKEELIATVAKAKHEVKQELGGAWKTLPGSYGFRVRTGRLNAIEWFEKLLNPKP